MQLSACFSNSNTMGDLLLESYISIPFGEITGLTPINKRLDSLKTLFAMGIFLPPNDLVIILMISSRAFSKLSAVILVDTSGNIAGIGSLAFKEHPDSAKTKRIINNMILLSTR
jgi:hypothetical protein